LIGRFFVLAPPKMRVELTTGSVGQRSSSTVVWLLFDEDGDELALLIVESTAVDDFDMRARRFPGGGCKITITSPTCVARPD